MTPLDELDQLRLADPVLRGGDPAEASRLHALRARVDSRRPQPVPAVGWGRRRTVPALVGAVAVLVPLGAGVVSPTSLLGRSVAPAAFAEDGTLDCGVGTSTPIDPADADSALLPATLPDGVSVVQTQARDETGRGWCGPSSLAALETDARGTVQGALRVFGPFDARLDEQGLGAVSPARVDGHAARLVVQDDAGLPFTRWFWTDADGSTWLAEVEGYEVAEAGAVVAGLSTGDGRVSWSPTGTGPALEVVHARTARPYSLDSHRRSWVGVLDDGSRRLELRVDRQLDDHVEPVVAGAVVGARLLDTADGVVVLWPAQGAEPGGADGPARVSLRADAGPGTAVYLDAATLEQGLRMLATLQPVAADDPRLPPPGGGGVIVW